MGAQRMLSKRMYDRDLVDMVERHGLAPDAEQWMLQRLQAERDRGRDDLGAANKRAIAAEKRVSELERRVSQLERARSQAQTGEP